MISFHLPAAAFILLGLTFAAAACERADHGATASSDVPPLTVYMSPTCGCCGLWADYMADEGFTVRRVEVPDIGSTRARLGVPPMLGSCHTGVIGGYLVEGHVPAQDVRRLLAEAPEARGISVPGMPIGSPGMEVPGREPQAYETFLFTADGQASVFARH